MILPKEDRAYATKNSMREQIIHLLGGRVAEKLTLDDISTGASNDIQRATDIARDMVTKYGFSEKLGPVNYSSGEEVFLGKDLSTKQNYSEEVAGEIDEEIRTIIEEAYVECERILTDNMEQLTRVAEALLEVETLDGEEFVRLFDGEIDAKGLAKELAEKEEDIAEKNRQEAAEMEKLEREHEESIFSGPIKLANGEYDTSGDYEDYDEAEHRQERPNTYYESGRDGGNSGGGHSIGRADKVEYRDSENVEEDPFSNDHPRDENREGDAPKRLDRK